MSPIEVKILSPDEMIQEIEESVRLHRENKYAFQVGLKDIEFDVNQDLLDKNELKIPFQTFHDAETGLLRKVIIPVKFVENDSIQHKVMEFDPRPVGYSGFMNCVTHSLALTDHGLFEVGRYSAVNLSSLNRNWQWFFHRRLATINDVLKLVERYQWSSHELMDRTYQAITGLYPD